MTHQIVYAARSDKGLIRSNNQDSVYAGDSLLVVADGMGGHAAGDMASRLVVGAFVPLDARDGGGDLLRALAKATRDGNSAIADVVHRKPELDGMGTTVTALLFDGGRLGMAHVGDSRAYLYRDGVLHQLTHDDTFVQSLIDDGRITQEEATHHPQRSLLLRALNGTEVDPSLTVREVTAGDRYLICSDGLPGVVSAEAIAETLGGGHEPGATADALIQLALVGGGPDNITVIVADVVDTGVGTGPTEVAAPADPDATGPIGSYESVRMTAEMPRVPLPAIPEDVPAKPEYLPPEDEDVDSADPRPGAAYVAPFDDGPSVSGPPDRRRSRRRRGALIGVVSLVVLASVAIAGSFVWVRSQYYVGASNGEVVVFRGVDGSVLGLRLSSVQEGSCEPGLNGCLPLKVEDLVPAARAQVVSGIQAGTLDDARGVVIRLAGQMLPPCPTPQVTPPVLPSASTAPSSPPSAALTGPSGSAPTTGSTLTGLSGSALTSARTSASSGPASATNAPGTNTGLSGPFASGGAGSGLIPGFGGAPSTPLGSASASRPATASPSTPPSALVSAPPIGSTPVSGSTLASTPSTGTSATPLSTRAPEPGVTCRLVR